MNKLLSHKFYFELTAIVIASVLFSFLIFLSSNLIPKDNYKPKKETFGKDQTAPNKGVAYNYSTGVPAELSLMSSLSRTDQITLFGSSEFSENPYVSFQFLPNEMGIPAMGFGHAFHQNFSIFCELLAGSDHLENSKVVIFLSPGWFETNGTNSEAFLEFVPQRFLDKIWFGDEIPETDKIEIGEYIYRNLSNFNRISKRMQSFVDLFQSKNRLNSTKKLRIELQKTYPSLSKGTEVEYLVSENPLTRKQVILSFQERKKDAQERFLRSCSNNSLFVDSTYYVDQLVNDDGSIKSGNVKFDPIDSNREYKDFMLLLDLLERKKVDCSFVIQGLNPHFYTNNLFEMTPLIHSIIGELEKRNMAYLNLFIDNQSEYPKGRLSDIMHLGEYGWMEVNEFIYKTYVK